VFPEQSYYPKQINEKDDSMNEDTFAGQWKQMRGALKSWWGNLTDDDFERIGGQKDKLIGAIQQRYGYSREQAQNDVERRFNEYGGTTGGGLSGLGTAVEDLKAKAHEFGASTSSTARETTAGVASGLETAGSYLKEKDLGNIAADFAGLVRKHPIQAVLIGAGLIYLLSRSTNR
jgi:uncharacterized protein YjbJ (UPF0337 family)